MGRESPRRGGTPPECSREPTCSSGERLGARDVALAVVGSGRGRFGWPGDNLAACCDHDLVVDLDCGSPETARPQRRGVAVGLDDHEAVVAVVVALDHTPCCFGGRVGLVGQPSERDLLRADQHDGRSCE